jgi:hypothetical protein
VGAKNCKSMKKVGKNQEKRSALATPGRSCRTAARSACQPFPLLFHAPKAWVEGSPSVSVQSRIMLNRHPRLWERTRQNSIKMKMGTTKYRTLPSEGRSFFADLALLAFSSDQRNRCAAPFYINSSWRSISQSREIHKKTWGGSAALPLIPLNLVPLPNRSQ